MRAFAWLGVLTLTTAALGQPPAAPPTPELTGDLKKMQGFWKPVSVMFDGTEQMPTDSERNPITLVIKNAEHRLYITQDASKDEHLRISTAELKLDSENHTFELVLKGGSQKGEKRHGIYDFADGNLRLCYGPADQPRPTTFDAPKGAVAFLEIWTREKR